MKERPEAPRLGPFSSFRWQVSADGDGAAGAVAAHAAQARALGHAEVVGATAEGPGVGLARAEPHVEAPRRAGVGPGDQVLDAGRAVVPAHDGAAGGALPGRGEVPAPARDGGAGG